MIITAVVVCADRPEGPQPSTIVGGRSMVARAVCALLATDLVDRVQVHASAQLADAVMAACRGLPADVHISEMSERAGHYVGQRPAARLGDGSGVGGPGEIVLLHEAARPLAPPRLATAAVDTVRSGHPAAVPVLPMTDTVQQVDRSGLVTTSPDRSTLCTVQTPMAVRAGLVLDSLPTLPRLLEAGVSAHPVPGHPMAFPVRTAWDLELAELLAAREAAR